MSILSALSPIDQRPLGGFTVPDAYAIAAAVATARAAAAVWADRPVKERAARVGRLATLLLDRSDHVVEVVSATTGKVHSEALLGEIFPLLAGLDFYRRQAHKILATRGVVTSPMLFPGARARIERKPFGVVAVIAPWNFPLQLSLMPMLTALIAGNAVILKPSELALPVGALIGELLGKLELPPGLVQVLPGARETAEQLIDAGPDLVFFTGGVAAGRAVMARAAQHPIPVILELGGKDPMVIFDDAPLERAVNAALYGAFGNSGQTCVAVERCYVQRGLYSRFVEQVVAATGRLQVGGSAHGDLGVITSARQIETVEAHYQDAVAKGAKASGPLRREGQALYPVVLWEVTQDMRVMREETFGPLLPVMPFDTEADAIRLANDSELGLNASVWTLDLSKGQRVASRLRVGGWSVNDVVKNVGHPGLPFGGVGRSGFGRYHGAEACWRSASPLAAW